MTVTTDRPELYPAIRYEDAPAGIAWLEQVLGFERHLVVPGENGRIDHAELRFGHDVLMLGSDGDDAYRIRSPRALGGERTLGIYLAASDVAERYRRAVDAGATIETALHETDYGSTDFSVRDPEDHVFSVGTYHPTATLPAGESADAGPPQLYAAVRYADARRAIAFLERAFGAAAHYVVEAGDGSIAHAEIRFGSSLVMLAAHDGGSGISSPGAHGGTTTGSLCVAIDDVDGFFTRAVNAGATAVDAPRDTEYGARMTSLRDIEGLTWTLGTYRPSTES